MTQAAQQVIHRSPAPKPGPAHYTFGTIPEGLLDCEKWPTATLPTAAELKTWFPHLSSEQALARETEIKDRFDRLSRGVRAYMRTGSLRDALAEAKCDKVGFYAQLNRCLIPCDRHEQGIVGWAGLVWQLRLRGYTRTKDGGGTAGQFQLWLRENPEWRETLERMIRKGNFGKRIPGRLPTVRGVAANFIEQFKRVDEHTGQPRIPLGTYPHDGKLNGRRAIERYIERYVLTHPEVTAVWYGKRAADVQTLGTGPKAFKLATAPFDVIGTDAHTFHCAGILILQGPAGEQRVPITRIQLVANLCEGRHACTGYSLCIQPQISAAHIDEAYLMGGVPWKPKVLTIEGLQYAEGAGFPCGSIEGVDQVNPGMVRVDNGSQLFANDVRTKLRRSLGCAVRWGAVGHWWRNPITERFFETLERYGFQRLPASMGSGPGDPHRADNPLIEATGRGITWDELVQLADVLMANLNAKPHTSLGGMSPLEAIRNDLSGRHATWFPRIRPPYTATSPRVGVEIVRGRIAGNREKGVLPYVEVDEVRYTQKCLSTHSEWIGRGVHIHIPRDMRTIEVFLDIGERIGVLECQHSGWAQSSHSRQVRKVINALIRKHELWVPAGGDPVVCYANHLERKAVAAAQKRPRVSTEASALADLRHTTGVSTSAPKTGPTEEAANRPHFDPRNVVGIALPDRWQ